MSISFFQPAKVAMICPDQRLSGAGGSLGCNKTYARFFGDGHYGFQEVRDVRPHLVGHVGALGRQRRQVLYFVVVERGDTGGPLCGEDYPAAVFICLRDVVKGRLT